MNTVFRLLLCAAIATCAGCARLPATDQAHNRSGASEPAPLLLISIDAYRHDYIDRGLSPHLEAMYTLLHAEYVRHHQEVRP